MENEVKEVTITDSPKKKDEVSEESLRRINAPEAPKTPEQLYEQLLETIHQHRPIDDLSIIEKAYDVAARAHGTQLRKSGEPYIIHPLSVAIILAELELDMESIVAGMMHIAKVM